MALSYAIHTTSTYNTYTYNVYITHITYYIQIIDSYTPMITNKLAPNHRFITKKIGNKNDVPKNLDLYSDILRPGPYRRNTL